MISTGNPTEARRQLKMAVQKFLVELKKFREAGNKTGLGKTKATLLRTTLQELEAKL